MSVAIPSLAGMLIDCDSCTMRDIACSDCVVSVLIGDPKPAPRLDADEVLVIDLLASRGMVPPLRFLESAEGNERQSRSG